MFEFFEKMAKEKKEYKEMLARVKALPENYRFVYGKIQKYMWKFGAGDGYDMVKVQYDLIDLFEAGAADGKHVLQVTGEDVAAFSDGLLESARTYMQDWRKELNRDVLKKLGKLKDVK